MKKNFNALSIEFSFKDLFKVNLLLKEEDKNKNDKNEIAPKRIA